jgi:hypothetical protein
MTTSIPRLGSDVVGVDYRAESPGRADRLEPGDADAEDQHIGRLGGPGRRGEQREVAPVGIRGKEHGLVATDIGL